VRVLLVLLLGLTVTGPACADVFLAFRTPSRNIGCTFDSGLASGTLRCDIRSGLRPRPGRPRGCNLDWGDSYTLRVHGRATLTCHGDTAIVPGSRVLRYGMRWHRGGLVCLSRVTGLRCTNRSGHGFFVSRARSYRF